MSAILKIPLNGGYVSTGTNGRAADSLDSGELVTMQSAYYRKNDPDQVWPMPGRSLFGSAGSTAIKGLAICQFDSGTDKLVASIGTTLVAATPGATGTFSSLATGLDSSATSLVACQQDDRWYIGNGYDENRVLKSDGTVRLHGLKAPVAALTVTPATTVLDVSRPTAFSDPGADWADDAYSYDGDENSFAFSGQNGLSTWSGWAANATAGRYLRILRAGTMSAVDDFHFNISQDGGATWDYNVDTQKANFAKGWFTYPITADSSLVKVAVGCGIGGSGFGVIYQVFDVQIQSGSGAASTTSTDGIYYAFTEYNSVEDMESPVNPDSCFSSLVTLSAVTQVTITRPTILNPAATHWRVYRIGDGVAKTIDNLGNVSGDISITSATWVDDFTIPITEQALPVLATFPVGDLIFPRDAPPPPFVHMMSWKGSICGISLTDRRSWAYSDGGRPESFPAPYVVESFPLDEHDGLVGQMAVGETAVLLCEGTVLAVDDLPRFTDGVFNSGTARKLAGHPGCVGVYAFTTYSVSGEPRGAWVSPFGVYITNGQTCTCISTDLAWEYEVNPSTLGTSVLRWDQKNLILWFEFDSDGDGLNDREMPFHMAPFHDKGNNRPKLGQPTEKATSCMASALIASTHYRFSGHPSNGAVYVEESGTVDAATSLPRVMSICTRQVDAKMVDMAIQKATVSHTDFGTGETALLTTTLYRDVANSQNSTVTTVRLDGNRGTTVFVGRAGQLADFQFDYSGTGSGGIGEISLEVDGQGRSGTGGRWVSASATP